MTGYLSRRNRQRSKMKAGRKALFLDMDGTVLDDARQISEGNVRALKQAIEAGHEVIVTTGRPVASAKLLLRNYGLDRIGCRYVIACNGGMVLDTQTGEILSQKTIPLEYMKKLTEEARRQKLYLQTYAGEDVLSERDDENLAYYIKRSGMGAKVVPDMLEALVEEPCKALAIDLYSPKPLEQFVASMAEWAEGKLDMYLSSRKYLEIVPSGVCKGDALTEFCARMGILLENSIAAGDEQNDISMLRAAGIGCAVANAQAEVKAAADYVTERDNNQSAMEEIVERFVCRGL